VAANESELKIMLDGDPVSPENAGTDVQEGVVHISGDRLYNLISSSDAGTHTLTIIAKPGFEIYTFTFG